MTVIKNAFRLDVISTLKYVYYDVSRKFDFS